MVVASCRKNKPVAITSDTQRISGQIVAIGDVGSIPPSTLTTLRVVNESTSSNTERSSQTEAAQMPFMIVSITPPTAEFSWSAMASRSIGHRPVADLCGRGAAGPGQRCGRGRRAGADPPLAVDEPQRLAVPGPGGQDLPVGAAVAPADHAGHDVAAAVGAALDQSAARGPAEGQPGYPDRRRG